MKTCLVVDDSSVVRKVARRILEAVERRDPEKAREAMREHLQQVREDSPVETNEERPGLSN